ASDVLTRWGGEEFTVMMSRCTADDATRLAEILRGLVAAWSFPEVGVVTISFGVAELGPQETLDAWLKRVDNALYTAKEAGRDCVCLAE
ncbi:MAG: GGDEF domain-containing protein, partial [Chromatiaceae bacterium]